MKNGRSGKDEDTRRSRLAEVASTLQAITTSSSMQSIISISGTISRLACSSPKVELTSQCRRDAAEGKQISQDLLELAFRPNQCFKATDPLPLSRSMLQSQKRMDLLSTATYHSVLWSREKAAQWSVSRPRAPRQIAMTASSGQGFRTRTRTRNWNSALRIQDANFAQHHSVLGRSHLRSTCVRVRGWCGGRRGGVNEGAERLASADSMPAPALLANVTTNTSAAYLVYSLSGDRGTTRNAAACSQLLVSYIVS